MATAFFVAIATLPPPINRLAFFTNPQIPSQLQFYYPDTTLRNLPLGAPITLYDSQTRSVANLSWSSSSSLDKFHDGDIYLTATIQDQGSGPNLGLITSSIAVQKFPSETDTTTITPGTFPTNPTGTPTNTASSPIITSFATIIISSTVTASTASQQQSKAWIAGPAVGAVAAIGLVIGAFLWRKRKKKQAIYNVPPANIYYKAELAADESTEKYMHKSPVEMLGVRPSVEMPSMELPIELPCSEEPIELSAQKN